MRRRFDRLTRWPDSLESESEDHQQGTLDATAKGYFRHYIFGIQGNPFDSAKSSRRALRFDFGALGFFLNPFCAVFRQA
jgi:hypothetical protein